MENFAERLKIARKSKNITQRQLAKELNISPSTVALYETGDRKPDFETLITIADYFSVTTDWLLGRKTSNNLSIASHNDGGDLDDPDLEMKIQRAVQRALKEEREKRK